MRLHLQIFILVILFYNTSIGQNNIPVEGNVNHMHPFMEVLVDANCSISQDDIINHSNFISYNVSIMNDISDCYWIRFSLNNVSDTSKQFFLNTVYFDSAIIYQLPEKVDKLSLVAETKMPIQISNFYSINIETNSKTVYYIKLIAKSKLAKNSSKISLAKGFDLITIDMVQRYFIQYKTYCFFIAGTIFIMFLFNLLLAFLAKETSYYWLAFYNLFFAINIVNSQVLMPSELNKEFDFIGPYIIMLLYIGFVMSFLKLKENFPKYFFVAKIHFFVALLSLCIHILGFPILALIVSTINLSIGIPTLLVMATIIYRKGYKIAIFIIIGSTIINISFINFCVGLLIETSDYHLRELLMYSAGFIELLIFTYASIIKYKKYQEKIIQLAFETELLESQKEELEVKVDLKSKELISKITENNINRNKQLELSNLIEQIKIKPDSKMLIDKATKILKELLTESESMIDEFLLHFNSVEKDFMEKLLNKHPKLSTNEIKLCAYLKMKLTSYDIATIQGIEQKSVNQAKYRLKKKLKVDGDNDLVAYLNTI